MTVEELQSRLRAASAAIGYGRLALTLSMDGREEVYITHWFRPDQHSFEDCRTVGSGALSECLDALERYVVQRAPVPALAAE